MSFPRYPAYKDSGVEWLGEVPGHWLVTKTKHVVQFTTGWTPPTGESSSYEGANLWANISDLGPKYLFDTSKRVSNDAIATSRMSVSPKGSLLFSFKLSIGQVSFAGQDMFTNEAIATFLPSTNLSLDFAFHAFPLLLVQNAAENIYGAKLLNQELIRSASFARPCLSEQIQISTFLDRETAKIDALVVEQQRLMALLKEKRQAVISHTVTKGLNPDAPMKPSGIEWLGDVPENWEVTPLKYVVSLRSGGTPSKANTAYWDGDVPWASSKDLKVEMLSDTQDHITQKAVVDGAADLVPAGSLLIVVRGMILIHTFPVVKVLVPMAINQDLKALTPSAKLDVDFLSWLLRGASKETLGRIDEAAHGTKVLRLEAWTSIPLPIPPMDEQLAIVRAICESMRQFDTLTAEAQRAIDLLQERRTALISAAVTGQIDVRETTCQT